MLSFFGAPALSIAVFVTCRNPSLVSLFKKKNVYRCCVVAGCVFLWVIFVFAEFSDLSDLGDLFFLLGALKKPFGALMLPPF